MGAILGIILGRKGLPEKWVAPLGDEITTNVGTGGIKNLKAPTMKAKVIYHDRAAVVGDAPTRLTLVVENPHSEPLQAKVSVDLPRLEEGNESWQLASSLPAKIDIPAIGEVAMPMAITCPPDSIGLSNQGTIKIGLPGRPALPRIPLVFLGGFRYLVSPVYHLRYR